MHAITLCHHNHHLTPASSRYLEGLCDYLYDDLRPRILHEPSLLVLCQVCTVLQALMILDNAAAGDGDSDEEGLQRPNQIPPVDRSLTARLMSLVGANIEVPKPLRRLNTAHLLQMILQDAQTRLFFKAQAIVQAEIRYFAPSNTDLDYPNNITCKLASLITFFCFGITDVDFSLEEFLRS